MAPNVLNSSDFKSKDINKIKEIKSKLREFKKFIKITLNTLETTLLMRQDQYIMTQKKKNKAIYGKASRKEIEDLKQEGIKTEEFPWIEDKEN